MSVVLTVALAGNPNAGKTSIFNAVTGARQHVGNWPGKTVARTTGEFSLDGIEAHLVDLPGTYSLSAFSPEELIARDYLLSHAADVVIDVIDATNLERNLYLTTQLMELQMPLVVALNFSDRARSRSLVIDRARLSALLGGVPVVETVASRGVGIAELLGASTESVSTKQTYLPAAA